MARRIGLGGAEAERGEPAPSLCFVLDNNVGWLMHPLWRRGFLVFAPPKDFPDDISDEELLDMARRLGCFVVSTDRFFEGEERAVYIPHRWLKRYNSWEITTKVIKIAAEKARRNG